MQSVEQYTAENCIQALCWPGLVRQKWDGCFDKLSYSMYVVLGSIPSWVPTFRDLFTLSESLLSLIDLQCDYLVFSSVSLVVLLFLCAHVQQGYILSVCCNWFSPIQIWWMDWPAVQLTVPNLNNQYCLTNYQAILHNKLYLLRYTNTCVLCCYDWAAI